MKFVHLADLHLDAKFDSLSSIDGLPQKRRLEQRKALKDVVEYIKENDIKLFLISGDLYEQNYIRKSSIEYVNKLFEEIPDTQIFIAPGNHDPYIKNSFYSTYTWSKNVHIFNENIEKIDFEDAHIYGFGFTDFYCKQSEIEEIQVEEPDDINILITHGSLDGGSDDLREYNPLRQSKLKQLDFDYIALGHIHKPYYNEEKNQKIFYPGATISLGFDELGEHGVLVGDIEKDELKVKFMTIDPRQYEEKEIDITEMTSNEEVLEKLQNLVLNNENLYKIILVGKRYFTLNTDEIKKLNSRENIVKIKDKTKVGIDIERIAEENNVRGIFVRNMLERKERENLDEDFIEKAIEIGLEVL